MSRQPSPDRARDASARAVTTGLRPMAGPRSAQRCQHGFVLLALLALLTVAGAASLLTYLQSAGERARVARDERTSAVLAEAHAALVAYAVSNRNAPGRLPFPDRSGDGNFDGFSDCVNVGTTVVQSHLLGRLPSRGEDGALSGCASEDTWTLGVEFADASGERLWYAVAPYLVFNGRSFAGVGSVALNTGLLDTSGGAPWLTVRDADGSVISDRVAFVIIAPGAALPGQEGRGAATPPASDYLDVVRLPDPANPGAYVSRSNADNDLDFVVYPASDTTSRPDCASALVPSSGCDLFNDRVAFVTIDELMPKVEQRVLGEVAAVLNDYRNQYSRYPWLSPVAPSLATGDYTGVPGTREGYLAYIDAALPETYPFDTGFTVSWTAGDASISIIDDSTSVTVSGGTIRVYAAATMDANNADFIDGPSSVTLPMPTAPPPPDLEECSWTGSASDVDCDYSAIQTTDSVTVCAELLSSPGSDDCMAVPPQPVTRTIVLDLDYSGTASVNPTPDGGRRRDVDSGLVFSTSSATTVTVTDAVDIPAFSVFGTTVGPVTLSLTRQLLAQSGDTANFVTTGIYYESRSDGWTTGQAGDLPDWFAEEQWGPYIYVSYAPNLLPGGSGSCAPGAECLTLNLDGVVPITLSDVQALAVAAGAEVMANTARVPLSSASETSFFEDQNASSGDDAFDRKQTSLTFNDQVRIIAP